jgi:hypothetical protein
MDKKKLYKPLRKTKRTFVSNDMSCEEICTMACHGIRARYQGGYQGGLLP